MNLRQALDVVARPLTYNGVSDAQLCDDVQYWADHDLGVRHVPALDGQATVRPVDVLLRLAVATKPQYQADLYEVHRHWSLLRYLGLFDADSDGQLCLSSAGRRIAGNQRRVTSEELGIGFAIHRAEEWMANRWPNSTLSRIVDIDLAITNGLIGTDAVTSSLGERRRPDYLMIAEIPGSPDRYRYALIECKGTKSWNYGLQQMASACAQLRGVAVAGRQPPGLAVGTVLAADWVYCRSLELSPSRPRAAVKRARRRAESLMPMTEAAEVHVDRGTFERTVHVDIDSAAVTAEDLVRAGVQASWASLADFSGNDYAFQRWAPPGLRALRDQDPDLRPPRVWRDTRDGLAVVGVRNLVTLPGGELEVVFGLAAEVDHALSENDADQVLQAQQRVAQQRAEGRAPEGREPGEAVTAISEEGAVLMLTPQ